MEWEQNYIWVIQYKKSRQERVFYENKKSIIILTWEKIANTYITNRIPFPASSSYRRWVGEKLKNKVCQGSLTVEASFVLPFFLFATLSILYICRLLYYEDEVQWALTKVAREISVEYAVSKKRELVNPVTLTLKMKGNLEDDLGVSMHRSYIDEKTDEIFLVADYFAAIPFPFFHRFPFTFTEMIHTRAFTGVNTRAYQEKEDTSRIVYVTDTGKVYHDRMDCTYLKLSVSEVKYEDLTYLRGEDGGKYYACERCGSGLLAERSVVYICNYGNRYHTNRYCEKLKRNIREVHLNEVGTQLPCSKCVNH